MNILIFQKFLKFCVFIIGLLLKFVDSLQFLLAISVYFLLPEILNMYLT